MASERKKAAHLRSTHSNSRNGWVLLVVFAFVVAIFGGASRFDEIQIAFIRGFCAFFLCLTLSLMKIGRAKGERTLIILLAGLALIMVLQLLPLPPLIWQKLHLRLQVSSLDELVGISSAWRPLSLTAVRTWNALASLVVPTAALFLAISLKVPSLTLLRVLSGLGILNAFLGLLQISTGRFSPLYLYNITNRGSVVGLLANENHAAIFAATSMLVVASAGLRVRQMATAKLEWLIYPVAFSFILFVSLAGGSRAGFLAAIGATMVSIVMFALSPRRGRMLATQNAFPRWFDEHPRFVLAVPVVIVSLIAASFLALDRSPAFRDIIAKDNLEDLRWSLWPVIIKMLKDNLFFGTGFGSFEQAYHIYEPNALLMPSYVNQAHNDWVQFLIEGGVLSGVLLLVLIYWIVKRVSSLASHPASKVVALFWVCIFTLVAAASVIDYPLRTPLFQVLLVWLLVALSRDASDIKAT